MKLATWNVNSLRARLDRALAWLDSRKPDVVCLQETKVEDGKFPTGPIEELGYQVSFHGQKTYNGVAILSRQPIEDVRRGFDDGEADDQARLIAGTVLGTRVVCAYFPNGKSPGTDKYDFKLKWMARLCQYLERNHQASDPLILCGDFNVAPDDRDVHDPEAWAGQILCTDEERAALGAIREWGLIDLFREHRDDAGVYSWWDYRMLGFPKNKGLRIDHIYGTQPMVARSSNPEVDREERKGKLPSDHAPVIITLD